MEEKLVGVNSMELHYIGENLTLLAVYANTTATTCKGTVLDTTDKGLPVILTKIPNNYQQPQDIPRSNNNIGPCHRG